MNTEIINLYNATSKHSNYQILPNSLAKVLPADLCEVKSRHETERLEFILKHLDFEMKTVCDIGGNTGFFSFSSVEFGAKFVDYFEGNRIHCDFVSAASKYIDVPINVFCEYITLETSLKSKYDIMFFLNVLHHLGDDFGESKINIEDAKNEMKLIFQSLSVYTKILVFQLGYNWKGDILSPLFPKGEKSELINFVEKAIAGFFKIKFIGIAEESNEKICYKDLNESNINRNDKIGEFLNRPLFILESLKYE